MLKGIEAQLMVTRTADLAREAGALQRKNDLARDYLAVQAQSLAELERKQVTQALRTQNIVLHTDKHGGGRQAYQEQEGDKNYGETEGDEYILLPPEAQSTIDIKV